MYDTVQLEHVRGDLLTVLWSCYGLNNVEWLYFLLQTEASNACLIETDNISLI